MLSPDGDSWEKAGTFTEIFKTSSGTANAAVSSVSSKTVTESQPNISVAVDPELQDEVWHYGIDGNSFGPVSKSKIIQLIKLGDLSKSDILWRSEMQEWTEIQYLDEFTKHFVEYPMVDTGGASGRKSKSSISLDGTVHLLRRQNPWVYFISVYMFIWAIGLFFAFVWGLIQGGKEQNPILITTALTSLVNMGVVTTAAYFLVRYASVSGHFTTTKKAVDLERALAWLGKFWLLIGVLIIIQIVVAVALAIYIFSLSAAAVS